MKIEYLPEKQEANNQRINRAIRLLLSILLILIICPVLAGAWLYLNGVPAAAPPQVLGPDKSSVLGDAVILTPNFVLCPGDCADGSVLALGHGDPMLLSKVRTDEIHAGVPATLLRTSSAISAELVHSLSDVEKGERVFANSSQGAWEGNVAENSDILSLEPTPTNGGFFPVYSKADMGLVGVATQANGGFVIVPVRDIKKKFTEIER